MFNSALRHGVTIVNLAMCHQDMRSHTSEVETLAEGIVNTWREAIVLVVKLPDVCSCRVPFATTGIRDCKTPGSACPVTVKLVPLLGTMRTFTGAQICIVEKGSTVTTAVGKAAEGAEGAAAELVVGNVICAADGTAVNTAIQAVTASKRQPLVVLIILIASV